MLKQGKYNISSVIPQVGSDVEGVGSGEGGVYAVLLSYLRNFAKGNGKEDECAAEGGGGGIDPATFSS